MKIDLLYELQRPGAHDEHTEFNIYWEAMAQIELADEMGFDTIWEVEHHFLRGFSHSSAPEVFLSAVAQRTKNIRIGHGVVLLPHKFNHPIRVAERIGALDILSKGRVEFGTGRSTEYEQEPFEIDPKESRAMWQEALEIIPQMWMKETFAYQGRYFKFPERHVIPKPIQKPHPRIWMACTSSESWEVAARNGIGPLGLTLMVPVSELEAHIALYREGLKRAKPVGAFINDRIGAFTIVLCGENNDEATNLGAEAAAWYIDRALRNFAQQVQPGPQPGNGHAPVPSSKEDIAPTPYAGLQTKQRLALLQRVRDKQVGLQEFAREDMIIVGDPDACIRKLKKYEAAGLDHVLCLMQAGRTPHDKIMKSIELFGKYVIPEFRA